MESGNRTRRWRTGLSGIMLVSIMSGCRTQPPPVVAPRPDDDCGLTSGAAPERIRLAVNQPVAPGRAPVARNESERLIFRQLYETLLRVDCLGRVVPGLAETWSTDDDGRTWTLRWRSDAAFSDGVSLTAAHVLESWQSHSGGSASTLFSSMTALGPREVRVVLRTPASTPQVFADARLAIARNTAGSSWPVGTGAYRVEAASPQRITMAPRETGLPTLEVHVAATDTRSALDEGVDAIVTRDTRTLEYARALRYETTALPWSRTYVLVGGSAEAGEVDIPPAVRAGFARDAVRGDVRGAEPPFWWADAACRPRAGLRTSGAAPRASSAVPRAIAHAAGDGIATALAERIAALSWPVIRTPAWLLPMFPANRAGRPLTVTAMNQQALEDAMRTDPSLAFVIAVPRFEASGCSIADQVWRNRTIAALVDARDHLIHRANIGRLVADGDGVVRFESEQVQP